jgi:hypothetical protein
MNRAILGLGLGGLLLGGALSSAQAASVNLLPFMSNPSFEAGGTGTSNPAVPANFSIPGWTISSSGDVKVYAPTSAQYTPGSDGLSGNVSVPNGSQVLEIPAFDQGSSGSVSQVLSGVTWTLNNTYTLNLFLGVPTGALAPNTRLDILFSNATSLQTIEDFSLTAPSAGQWVDIPISFTDSASGDNTGNTANGTGIQITILSFATQSNGYAADFDFAAAATPLPGAFPLFAGGLGFVGYLTRRKKRAQAIAA